MPELGLARENIVFVSGIGCSSRFPYYMNTYGMHSIHGRAPAIATGLAVIAPRPVGLGGDRRRRRAVDRRQPPDPRVAPQREPEDPAVQQPDLRTDQGPVLPDLRDRQDHQVDADGLAGQPVQPGVGGARRRGHLRGANAGLRPQAPDPVLRAAADHQGTALVEIYQNCNIFNDGAFDLLKDAETRDDWTSAGARPAAALRRRREDGGRSRRQRFASDRAGRCAQTTRGSSCTTRTPRIPPTRSRCRACRRWTALHADGRVPGRCEQPTYDAMMAQQLELAAAKGPGDDAALTHCCAAPTPGRSPESRP